MKKWLTIAVMTILAAGLIVNGVLYAQSRASLTNARSDISSIKQDVSAFETITSDLQAQVTDLSSSINDLQARVTDLSASVTDHYGAVNTVVAQLAQAVVRIDAAGFNFQASGSGSIIDNRGYVLTNYHVIEDAHAIQITVMDMTVFNGTVVASDQDRDLALLKIATDRTDFATVAMGQPSDVVVGEDVIAAGFPLGTELPGPVTFTRGIISALRLLGGFNYIQIDAPINPGNSGGCLATLNGKMIGVPSAGIVPPGLDIEDIGLAIPIGDVMTFIQQSLK